MEGYGFKRLAAGGLITLLVTQLLYGALILSALYKQYQEPVLQVNGLLCKDMADHLSLFVRVGKSLRPSTLERYIAPLQNRHPALDIVVTGADGEVLYPQEQRPPVAIPKDAKAVFGPVRKFSGGDRLWVSCPVTDRKGATVSHVFAGVGRDAVLDQVYEASKPQFRLFGLITLAESLLLGFLLFRFARRHDPESRRGSLALRLSIMSPLVAGHVLFLALLLSPLHSFYQQSSLKAGQQVAQQIALDLERLVGMGMRIGELKSMDEWLVSRQRFVPSLGIAVYDEQGRIHCVTDSRGALGPDLWEERKAGAVTAHSDILDRKHGETAGFVAVAMDADAAMRNLRSVMLDNLTLTVVSVLFLAELIYLLLMSGGGVRTMVRKPEFMRPVVFSCLFGTEMAMSYVPIRIGEIGLELFGLPPDVVSGLPVSCELFMAGAAMLVGGFWSQRSGWRPMLLAGIALAGGGSFLSWLSNDAPAFILSRGFAGLGYGFINLSAQVFVIAHSPAENRARNLAFMFAGLYAGCLGGSALGGLIADRLGYAAVFPASAALLFLLAGMLWRSLPRERWVRETRSERFTLGESLKFFADRRMGALLAFFIIPNALITVCLFQFFVPLSLSQAGTSPASIGRVFLVYCVIVMFAGPAFGTLIDRARRMEQPLFLSMLIAAASVLCLVLAGGLAGAMLCVSLLALNTAIASNGQGAYALSLPAAQRFGKSRTMGFYNVAMRIGQVLGPLSLGVMMSVWDVRFGLIALACYTLVCAVLFLALSWRGRESR